MSLTSSAVVATTSNPMNEKKTTDAAEKMPWMPNGAKGLKLDPAAYGMPAHTTKTTTARLIIVMMVLNLADSCSTSPRRYVAQHQHLIASHLQSEVMPTRRCNNCTCLGAVAQDGGQHRHQCERQKVQIHE